MKYLLSILALFFSYAALAAPQIGSPYCDAHGNYSEDWSENYYMLDEQNEKPYVGAASWYYDPDTPGIGLSITIQQSVHSPSGYFVFGVFYTYKDDGSQAWYAVDGTYVPTMPDENEYWQKDTEDFGMRYGSGGVVFNAPYEVNECWWGNSNTYLGEFESDLVETANGAVVDGDYSPHDVWSAGKVRIRWVNPDKVEIYMNGASTPAHSFGRHKFSSGHPTRNADFITKNTYFYEKLQYDVINKNYLPCPECYHSVSASALKGTMRFRKFDHKVEYTNPDEEYFTSYDAFEHFERYASWKSYIQYYISTKCIRDLAAARLRTPLNPPAFVGEIGTYGDYYCKYIILAYDPQTDWLEAFLFTGIKGGDDISRGLWIDSGGFTFRAPLPPADQPIINLFAGTYNGSIYDDATRSFTMYRSNLTLYKLPELGGLFEQMPSHFKPGWNIPVESD